MDQNDIYDEDYRNEEYLAHIGVARRSGRYPWGSGDHAFQRGGDFLDFIDGLKNDGMTEKEVISGLGMTSTEYRYQTHLAKNERRANRIVSAQRLKAKGFSNPQIAEKIGVPNESSVRELLKAGENAYFNTTQNTIDMLKKHVDEKGIIDIGSQVERDLGISRDRLNQAAYALSHFHGYEIQGGRIEQQTNPGQYTTLKVLSKPGTPHKDMFQYDNIKSINDYTSLDDGETFEKKMSPNIYKKPSSFDSKRLEIRYAEDGGDHKDGIVELRPGVKDISLNGSMYSQVRILVDNKKYIKGMAVYANDLPDGVDIRFNTNKTKDVSKMDVLKNITDDPKNPFGATIKRNGGQYYYIDDDGNKQLSVINKHKDEGDWGSWSKELPSQFLSKQKMSLIEKQLTLSVANKKAELEEIEKLTNPTLKAILAEKYALSADKTAVGLQAASLPGQKYQVILPLPSLKDNEVYAPNFKDGSSLALVRFPHGGIFEIPILKVNNKNKEGVDTIGKNALDAVGINKKNADILSGADFDGDTVMCIPVSNKVQIWNSKPLKDLEGFDPKLKYHEVPGMKYMKYTNDKGKTVDTTEKQMGMISNLITDMTLKDAKPDELARAVKHSMVVIDAAKHKLNYTQSEKDNGIAALKKKYQGYVDPETGKEKGGASTLISRAKSDKYVDRYKGDPNIDPETGEASYTKAFTSKQNIKELDQYVDYKTGEVITRQRKTTAMGDAKDAHILSSGTLQEKAYAEYANSLKQLANDARKISVNSGKIEYSASANKIYSKEVESLNEKLNVALKNKPRERQAQYITASVVNAKKASNPNMTKEEIKKYRQQTLEDARVRVGAMRNPINIEPNEWAAIQAGAIPNSRVKDIFNNTNQDQLFEYATPKASRGLTSIQTNRLTALKNSGYTNQQIAEALGVSVSTVLDNIKQ